MLDRFLSADARNFRPSAIRAFAKWINDPSIISFAGRAEWTSADGGLFTFMTLEEDIDTAARVEKAVANGVVYVPGAPFFVDGSGRNTMRLTFAKEPDARIREGVGRLAAVFE